MNGKLIVVGLGPGGPAHMTPAARGAIEAAEVVAGYKTYLELVPELIEGKRIVSSGMRKEVERCRLALQEAAEGRRVALISSGDAGIYGMAGLALELAEDLGLDVEVEIVPGVSAVQAAAARLGAPLMHDFAVISLSDLLTPWELIRRRLEAAAAADFVVALYNPRSKGRTRQILEARDILLRYRPGSTPVGIVRSATRSDETVEISDLDRFTDRPIDMFSLVLIGNASTRLDGKGRMVTPRGYETRARCDVRAAEVKARNIEHRTSNLTDKKCAALFVGGTGSDVGKSVLAAGLCRLFARRGGRVAPFKAQNMALNSAVTPAGGEIGRAQALQAAACGLPPHTDMNPVLLKPNSETGSQVIIQGRPVGNMSVSEYHNYKAEAFTRVKESFGRLASACDLVVMEGAGSIAEINLMAHDITNLRAAAMAQAPVLLVADIDRGGVFASIVGTLELLSTEQRRQVAGVVINKFRGDAALLRPGIEEVERRTGVPVLGVVPWINLKLPEEDSVALARKTAKEAGSIRIGVVRLPRISNYTDFDALEHEPEVSLRYLESCAQIADLDLLILPGTKNTLDDLAFLQQSGFAEAIRAYHSEGGRIAGICGGFQMLGHSVIDVENVESNRTSAEGLGLLDVTTRMRPDKQTHQAAGELLPAAAQVGLSVGAPVAGYEIHMGETSRGPQASSFARLHLRSGDAVTVEEGAVSPDGRVWGSYLHGLFDNEALRRDLLVSLGGRRGESSETANFSLERELDRLADHLERYLDLERIEALLGVASDEGAAWTG